MEEFSLVFAYLHCGHSENYLASQFSLCTTQLKVILHNGSVLLAVFWAYHHLRLRSVDEVWNSHTTSHLKEALGSPMYVLITDNFEFEIGCPQNLLLNHMAYSQKLSAPGYLKQLVVCYSNGIIACRAPLFGSRASEVAPLEELQKRRTNEFSAISSVRLILLFVDRGFRLLHSSALVWCPSFQAGRPKFQAEEVVIKQVRPLWHQVLCLILSIQLQSAHRGIVEQVNHLLEQHKHLFHLHPTQYNIVEFFVHVMTAFTNYHQSLSIRTRLLPGTMADFQNNLRELESLLAPPDAPVVAPISASAPPPTLAQQWVSWQSRLPSQTEIAHLLQKRYLSLLENSHVQLVGPPQLTACVPFRLNLALLRHRTDFMTLSKRAKQLLDANYVSLVQFSVVPATQSTPEGFDALFWIHAHVHSCEHQVLLRIPSEKPQTYEAHCTCLVG